VAELRVAVAGGGLGGLCLAQGLLARGVAVTVFERDPTLTARRQGYRLHLDTRGGLALRECLPGRLFALVMATAGHVGADGVNSVVRRQLLPQARVTDTGARCLYGRTPLDEATVRLLPAPLRDGFMAVIGGRVGVAAGLMQFRHRPEIAAAEIAPSVQLSPALDYLMWAVSAQREQFPLADAAMGDLDATGLYGIAKYMTRTFHPDLRSLIGHAVADETFLVRVRSAEPVPAWPAGRVTLLGDAIHAMSPARGSGANTALHDAATLCRALTEQGKADTGLVAAIARYEAAMRDYGFAAVMASREAETVNAARGNGVLFRLARRLPAPGRSG